MICESAVAHLIERAVIYFCRQAAQLSYTRITEANYTFSEGNRQASCYILSLD